MSRQGSLSRVGGSTCAQPSRAVRAVVGEERARGRHESGVTLRERGSPKVWKESHGHDYVSCMGVVVHAGRLRLEMVRRGWSAADLARESGISQATISAALSGKAVAARSIGLLASALARMPPSEVIDGLLRSSDTVHEID